MARFDAVIDALVAERHRHEDRIRRILSNVMASDRKVAQQIVGSDTGTTTKTKRGPCKKRKTLHWTQRPENKAKVRAMAEKGNATRREKERD